MLRLREQGILQQSYLIIINGGHAQDLDGSFEGSSHLFAGITGPLQSVQRAEYWGVILALQAFCSIQVGIDNLNVLGGVAKIVDSGITGTPLLLIMDGDFLAVIRSVLCVRGEGNGEGSPRSRGMLLKLVDKGDARHDDLVGNDGADTAADWGRLRQQDGVISARRALIRVRLHWYLIMLELHKFMVAISRIEVLHDGYGGTAPDAMIWDKGSIIKPRASSLRVIVDRASLPGPPGFLESSWCSLSLSPTAQEDVAVWAYTVSILLEFSCLAPGRCCFRKNWYFLLRAAYYV